MEFGTRTEALAADVDDGIADEDLEALDSDEEYEDDPDAMLEEREEDSDSKRAAVPQIPMMWLRLMTCLSQLRCIFSLCTPCFLPTSR